MNTKFSCGNTHAPAPESGHDMWVAGVNIDDHINAIECYGMTEKRAESRRDLVLYALMEQAARTQPTPTAPVAQAANWEGADEWMPLAWELCANECGEEACNELIWDGGPVPEPWGDRWLKYEDQAKEMIAMVRKHVPATPPAQPEPVASVAKYCDECGCIHKPGENTACPTWGRAQPAPVVPSTHKLVPIEPSPAMLVALWDHREAMRGHSENKIARAGYAAMLAAAPQPLPLHNE